MENRKQIKKYTINNTRKPLHIGEFLHFNQCRFCYSKNMRKIMDFGYIPLAGGFFPKNSKSDNFENEKYYPLQIYFCSDCFLLQSNNCILPDILFKKYFYFSSSMGTLSQHFSDFTEDLVKYYKDPQSASVLEIGCNDGVFLKPLMEKGFKAVGVDPASNIVKPLIKKGYKIVNKYFNEKTALFIKKKYGLFDVITGTSSLAHIDDMRGVLKGITVLLKPDGIFIMEEHYLGSLIGELQYDMMYHEHPSYYGYLSLSNFLKMFNMEIFKVKYSPIRAGLMRYYIKYKENTRFKIDTSALKLKNEEIKFGFDKLHSFKNYSILIRKTRVDLIRLLTKIKNEDKTIAGYGASGRGTIISAYCGLTEKYLDYVIDDAPQKIGIYTPFNHLKVQSSEVLNTGGKRPDYVLLFAWPFWKEVKNRNKKYLQNGGKFIIPLPKLKIIGT